MEYALTQPRGLASIVIESSPAGIPGWVSEANRSRAQLPDVVRETLEKHEAARARPTIPNTKRAVMVFYRRHVCRLEPWPDYVRRAFAKLAENPEVDYTMNGPSEFHVVGVIKELEHRAPARRDPCASLLTSGRHDEATPELVQVVHDGIPGSEWVVFEDSAHMAHAEETKSYLEVVDDFLTRPEASPSSPGMHSLHGRTAEADHLLQAPLLWAYGSLSSLPRRVSSRRPGARPQILARCAEH